MRPTFQGLMQRYPRWDSKEKLYTALGWADLIHNPAFKDTCAIRMSYALVLAGENLPGARMKGKVGAFRGQPIEPGQAKLSEILKRRWGEPEVFQGQAAARDGIGRRTGVASFWRIEGGNGGHIDLIWSEPGHTYQDCARSCYFSAVTVWFWPLT